MNKKKIIFSSCFYIFKSKFPSDTYIKWMNNFLSIVNDNIYLVIYTNKETRPYIDTKNNLNIHVVIKPITEFYGYKYKNEWIRNHEKNVLLNNKVEWEINMLWNEKINFVYETYKNDYFQCRELKMPVGWCDIGYFRDRHQDERMTKLKLWGKNLSKIDITRINYACVNINNMVTLKRSINIVNGLPDPLIPDNQVSIAGGFFVISGYLINWWRSIYYDKLSLYFQNNLLVKDDQIIILTCILEHFHNFKLHIESSNQYDNWFMFQRILN